MRNMIGFHVYMSTDKQIERFEQLVKDFELTEYWSDGTHFRNLEETIKGNPHGWSKRGNFTYENNPWFFDHVLMLRGQNGVLGVSNPYFSDERLVELCSEWCEPRGLEYVICGPGSDIHNGKANMVLIMTPQMRQRYASVIETSYDSLVNQTEQSKEQRNE